jgi:hypothetical protein
MAHAKQASKRKRGRGRVGYGRLWAGSPCASYKSRLVNVLAFRILYTGKA